MLPSVRCNVLQRSPACCKGAARAFDPTRIGRAGRMHVFELYVGDELVAADFGHAVGARHVCPARHWPGCLRCC